MHYYYFFIDRYDLVWAVHFHEVFDHWIKPQSLGIKVMHSSFNSEMIGVQYFLRNFNLEFERGRYYSVLKLWVRTPFMARCTRWNIMYCSLSVSCDRSVVFRGTPVSSTNKTDCHNITKILLKVAFNTINQAKPYHFSIMAYYENNHNLTMDHTNHTTCHYPKYFHASFFSSK